MSEVAAERWVPVADHPGYEVSDHGRVRSVDRVLSKVLRGLTVSYRRKGQMLKVHKCTNDYLFATLGAGNMRLVHRLVAGAFVRGDRTLDVNHKDGARGHNHFSNLEWATRSENIQHSYDHLPRKQHAKTTPTIIGGVRYPSQLAAANAVGVTVGSIHSAVNKGHRCRGMEVTNG